MSGFLDNLDELDSLKWLINEILSIINHISPAEITKELNKIAQKDLLGNYLHKDPYLHFYETFLSQYDPKLRESRGVYYTPFPIVKFIIDSIDLVLKDDFKQTKGLGSALTDDNITLLDFATGTGTFLLEAFRKALESLPKNPLDYINPKVLLPKFSGFEFLIAPYTIAHLKISQSFKEEFNAPLDDSERLNIYLTNTLQNKTQQEEQYRESNVAGLVELTEEFLQSQRIKQSQILIITGNPPYKGDSANKGLFDDEIAITYGLEPSLQKLNKEEQKQIDNYFNPNISGEKFKQAKKTFQTLFKQRKLKDEKNPKWLKDDYMKFICFAESKVQAQEQGIVAIITNHGFIDNVTFRGARWHLLNNFDKIYILDLHGNVKRQEKDYEGKQDGNVFGIQQGVSINIFVKTGQKKQDLAQVYHYDLYGTQQDKYNFLLQNDLHSVQWKVFTPKPPYYLFFSYDEALFDKYVQYISIKDIFKSVGVGITTAHDDFVIDSDKERLLQKFNDFRDSPPSANELHKKFNVKEKANWDILKGWQNLQGESNLQKYIQKIAYRPFDMRYIFYEEKLVWRCVKDIMQHFTNQNLGIVFSRQVVGNEFQHNFIVDTIMESCYISNRTKEINYIAPLYLVESDSRSENFTQSFRAFIDTKYGERFAPEVILGYIYAVLFHKDYREKFLDFLKIDFPRIPFVESKEQFLALSALGGELINLHLKKDTALNESVGQDTLIDENIKDLTIQNFSYVAQEKRLFINKNLYFTNVSKEVWEYKIGGYQVLDTYLSYHKNEQINKDFREIVRILHKSLEIEAQIAKISIF